MAHIALLENQKHLMEYVILTLIAALGVCLFSRRGRSEETDTTFCINRALLLIAKRTSVTSEHYYRVSTMGASKCSFEQILSHCIAHFNGFQ